MPVGIPVHTPVLVSAPPPITDVNRNSTNTTNNFAAAFKPKTEPNLKNASSWSSLAQSPTTNQPGAPPTTPGSIGLKGVADQFQAFKKQAKEKMQKQRALIEQQEMRRHQKEQAERERLRLETERRREKEEEEALEKARKAAAAAVEEVRLQAAVEEVASPNPVEKSAAEREKQRLREQERRRREAMASQIEVC